MKRESNWAAQFFLVLCPAAVGCLLGGLILDPNTGTRPFAIACVTVALAFVVAGAAGPVFTIKKPLHSYRLLAGIGHSPLSRQAVLVGLFTVVLVIYWALMLAGVYVLWLGIVVTVIGAGAVLAAGLVYLLGSQPVWRHWSTPLFLFGGLLALGVSTSMVIALGWRGALLADTSGALAARILVLVGVAVLAGAIGARSAHLSKDGLRPADTWALIQHEYRWSHWLSAALVIVGGMVAAAGFAADWVIIAAFVVLLAALFVLWRLFFVTAAPLSWKAEVQWSVPASALGKE